MHSQSPVTRPGKQPSGHKTMSLGNGICVSMFDASPVTQISTYGLMSMSTMWDIYMENICIVSKNLPFKSIHLHVFMSVRTGGIMRHTPGQNAPETSAIKKKVNNNHLFFTRQKS